jgi:hypothetical protein
LVNAAIFPWNGRPPIRGEQGRSAQPRKFLIPEDELQ